MIIINAPLKADLFRQQAEVSGLVFKEKKGMKMIFEYEGGSDAEKAAELKKQFKGDEQLAAIFFQVTAE